MQRREYPCGCSAVGSLPLPTYCAEHDARMATITPGPIDGDGRAAPLQMGCVHPATLPDEVIDYSKFSLPKDALYLPLRSVHPTPGAVHFVESHEQKTTLPTDAAARKNMPITTGVLDYFPAAIAEVARVSYIGNEKHNPGEDLHHARGKSMDHADCIARHLTERGTIDTVKLPDGREFLVRHSAYVAWRALALLQEELEAAGAPRARGAR